MRMANCDYLAVFFRARVVFFFGRTKRPGSRTDWEPCHLNVLPTSVRIIRRIESFVELQGNSASAVLSNEDRNRS